MIPAVSVSNIHKKFGDFQALCSIDFNIEDGLFFGLLGPNGAGKSTLINIMAGLARADMGTIHVMGNDVRADWRKTRRTLGIVPQELAYDPFFTAREMLRLQSGYFGKGKENHAWIDELLDRLGLTDKADENMLQLSGGMKKRVLIAQALVHKPRVLVLDEPTAGVDVELRKTLWKFIRQLHGKGHTILLTTHYLEEAEALCDRIAILDHGKLIANDTTEALLELCPYRFLNLSLSSPLANIPELIQKKVVSFDNSEIVLRLHRTKDSIGSVLDALNSADISFHDLHINEPGLEQVFLSLTGAKDD